MAEKLAFFFVSVNESSRGGGLSMAAKLGIGIAGGTVVLIIVVLLAFAFFQKKRADKAEEHQNPFGMQFMPYIIHTQFTIMEDYLIYFISESPIIIIIDRPIKLSLFFVCYIASWPGSDMKDMSGAAPKVEGPRHFLFSELKQASNNFSESNEIGSGAYGKVCIHLFMWILERNLNFFCVISCQNKLDLFV